MDISIIIPVYNEEENLKEFNVELVNVLETLNKSFEIIYVNDGSKDKSIGLLRAFANERSYIKIISFARNYGQTAALAAGINNSTGQILIFLDSDLQNDPHDIPMLIQKISEGNDVVSGWRKNRKDKTLSRRIPSMLANLVIARITGVSLHDFGCTLKAYSRHVIEHIQLFGEMHRFIPAYASWYGAKVVEVVVNHRPRIHGHSKYGLNRTLKVLVDLLFVKFWHTYRTKPMHFFGGIGMICFTLSIISGITTIILRLGFQISFIQTPLPLLTVFAIIAGVQFILIGVVAEMLVRVYFNAQNDSKVSPYIIKERINIE